MAVSSLQVSWTTIREQFAMMAPWNSDPDEWTADQNSRFANILRLGLNKAYHPPKLPEDKKAHQWNFLRPEITITTSAPYATGTVAIAAGVVTLTGGAFPTWAASGWLYVGGTAYPVATRDGNTQVTLVDTSVAVAAGTAYELRRYRYNLDAYMPASTNFGGLVGTLYYQPGQSLKCKPLDKTSEERIRSRYQRAFFSIGKMDYPTEYALISDGYAPAAGQQWSIAVWPSSNAVHYLTGECHVTPFDIDAANPYPAGGAMHGQMIMEAILSEAELGLFDAYGEHQQKYLQALATSISIDKEMKSPDSLGTIPGGLDDDGCIGSERSCGDFYLQYQDS